MTRVSLLALAILAGPALAADFALPDPKLTPGAIDPTVGYHEICDLTTAPRRKVTKAARTCAFRRYGLPDDGRYEGDHLVPLELGGANTCDNLWPQRWAEADIKDQCEDAMRAAYCHGPAPRPKLADLQRGMASGWTTACTRYLGR